MDELAHQHTEPERWPADGLDMKCDSRPWWRRKTLDAVRERFARVVRVDAVLNRGDQLDCAADLCFEVLARAVHAGMVAKGSDAVLLGCARERPSLDVREHVVVLHLPPVRVSPLDVNIH